MILRDKSKEPKPKLGDTIIKTKFAFFPTEVGDQTIWLERYNQHYKVEKHYTFWGDMWYEIVHIPTIRTLFEK